MKCRNKKTPTFGDFIACIYSVCSRRKAKAIVRFAVNRHVIVFRTRQRFVVC